MGQLHGKRIANAARPGVPTVMGLMTVFPAAAAVAGSRVPLAGPLAQSTVVSYGLDILILLALFAAAIYVVCKSSRRR